MHFSAGRSSGTYVMLTWHGIEVAVLCGDLRRASAPAFSWC